MLLKDGTEVDDPRLDRIYEEDWNSLNFPITAKLEETQPYELYEPKTKIWFIDKVLDQGKEGACVGFAYSHDAIACPNHIETYTDGTLIDAYFARTKIYWESQKIDSYPGGAYPGATPFMEGTSVLSAAKIMQQLGLYSAYYWALTLMQLALGVAYEGPAVLGVKWTAGQSQPDTNQFIHVSGQVVGGHAILCKGVVIFWVDPNGPKNWANVDLLQSYFVLHNSWGSSWGNNGSCKISFKDMDELLTDQGEACFSVLA